MSSPSSLRRQRRAGLPTSQAAFSKIWLPANAQQAAAIVSRSVPGLFRLVIRKLRILKHSWPKPTRLCTSRRVVDDDLVTKAPCRNTAALAPKFLSGKNTSPTLSPVLMERNDDF